MGRERSEHLDGESTMTPYPEFVVKAPWYHHKLLSGGRTARLVTELSNTGSGVYQYVRLDFMYRSLMQIVSGYARVEKGVS